MKSFSNNAERDVNAEIRLIFIVEANTGRVSGALTRPLFKITLPYL